VPQEKERNGVKKKKKKDDVTRRVVVEEEKERSRRRVGQGVQRLNLKHRGGVALG
jgi:hypothetical protein